MWPSYLYSAELGKEKDFWKGSKAFRHIRIPAVKGARDTTYYIAFEARDLLTLGSSEMIVVIICALDRIQKKR